MKAFIIFRDAVLIACMLFAIICSVMIFKSKKEHRRFWIFSVSLCLGFIFVLTTMVRPGATYDAYQPSGNGGIGALLLWLLLLK